MKKRSGEAQAAQHRPPAVFKHRLTPRGGARNDQPELLDEAPGFEPDDGYADELEGRWPNDHLISGHVHRASYAGDDCPECDALFLTEHAAESECGENSTERDDES
jgi:hypothetical protein